MLVSLFNKVAGSQAHKFIRKRLQHRCFHVKLAKFLRTPFLKNTSIGCFCNKSAIKAKTFWKNKFYIILHFLSLWVFISIHNIGQSIPLIFTLQHINTMVSCPYIYNLHHNIYVYIYIYISGYKWWMT